MVFAIYPLMLKVEFFLRLKKLFFAAIVDHLFLIWKTVQLVGKKVFCFQTAGMWPFFKTVRYLFSPKSITVSTSRIGMNFAVLFTIKRKKKRASFGAEESSKQ